MNDKLFLPAEILLPRHCDMSKWAVIACDQFTSDRAYWERVRRTAGDAPSAIRLILPEAELGSPREAEEVAAINQTLADYLEQGLFAAYPASYVYVERTLESGAVRQGLVGMLDLEGYDYAPGSVSPIRATEKTVTERIPPRQRVRRDAPLELPHVLMLCDDHERRLIEAVGEKKGRLPQLYDFELMEGGGRIRGWLVTGKDAEDFDAALAAYVETVPGKYKGLAGVPMVFAVGDGNHSLATAKSCYEELKRLHPGEDLSRHPARWALVELENIHADALVFEPIHRVLQHTEPDRLLRDLAPWCSPDGFPVRWFSGGRSGEVRLDRSRSELAVGVLQSFLDGWLKDHPGEIDYIHDDDALISLSAGEDAIGFLLPGMEKSQLFRGVIHDGALPRKTFSMGHSREKRYYLEARKIR